MTRPLSDCLVPALIDKIRADLTAINPSHPALGFDWSAETRLDGDIAEGKSIGFKSLDLTNAASAVAEAFHIAHTGLDDLLLARRTIGDWAELAQRALDLGQAQKNDADRSRVMFTTSGTTGEPKKILHRLDDLGREIDFWAARFADRRRILCLVPRHHIYGFLFGVLLPYRLGVPVLDGRAFMPGGLARTANGTDLIIGHPAFWDLFAGQTATSHLRLPEGCIALSSTGPLAEDSRQTLAGAGCAGFFEIYGSSETAGIGYRPLDREDYELLPYWSIEGSALVDQAGCRVALPDHINETGPGRFVLGGRVDRMMQIGGMNVSLAAVAAAIEGEFTWVERCDPLLDKYDGRPRLVLKLETMSNDRPLDAAERVLDKVATLVPAGLTPSLEWA